MADHNVLGKKGEEHARKYLFDKGYKILQNNWRFGKDEIDIIFIDKEKNQLVITEVKTRMSNVFGEPEIAVTKSKQKFLIRATQIFIEQNNIDLEARFDIIAITVVSGKFRLNHIENAFYPTL